MHHNFAVAELAGHFNLARNACQAFEPVTGNHAGVVAGTTGDDLNIANLGEQFLRLWTESLNQYMVSTQAIFQGALNYCWLLVDFLEHVVAILALVGRFGAIAVLHGFALNALTVYVPDLHAVTTDFSDIAFFQVHEAVSDLAQCQLVGGQEVFTQAQANHQRAAAAGCNQTIRLLGADHSQAVGTVQLFNGGLEGLGQVAVIFEFVV